MTNIQRMKNNEHLESQATSSELPTQKQEESSECLTPREVRNLKEEIEDSLTRMRKIMREKREAAVVDVDNATNLEYIKREGMLDDCIEWLEGKELTEENATLYLRFMDRDMMNNQYLGEAFF